MTRILLTGANGQVGEELQQTLAPLGEVISVDRTSWDMADPDAIRPIVQNSQPSLIVNAAAYTAVDKAESELDLAHLINGKAAQALAEEAEKLGAGLIHISTDYVFDGKNSSPYLEIDPTNPLGAYGQSKLMGEEAVRDACQKHMIIRTAWVYGVYGKGNFVKTMLRVGGQRDELRVVTDQIGAPTWAKDLALAIAQLAPQLNADTAGTYHYTNSGVCSWYDFAIAIFEEAKALGFPLQVQRVVPITTEEYPTPARRPAFSVLSLKKISSLLGEHPPYWRQSLRKMLVELQGVSN
ncbi:MAG: dTDP-4-dehydrorhamnose reductase [Oscillatoriales cyanobacterium C42_A2020_001]|nr:dTDP-4-dehydrorhamnose reductase [Leptolyngbyaceae cyanobacterium C42_A2020_001]